MSKTSLRMFNNRESLPKWTEIDRIKFERCKQWEKFEVNSNWPFNMRLEVINTWDQILRNDLPSEQLQNYIKESRSFKIRKIEISMAKFKSAIRFMLERKLYRHELLIRDYINEINDIRCAFRKWELEDNLNEYKKRQENIAKERRQKEIKQMDELATSYGLPTFSYISTLNAKKTLKVDGNFVNIYECGTVCAIIYEDKLNNNVPRVQYYYTIEEAELKAQEILREMTFQANNNLTNKNKAKKSSPIIGENISKFFNNNDDNYNNNDNDIF